MNERTLAAARRALAAIMALLLALGGPLGHVALAREAGPAGGAYLADVRVGVGATEQEAARALSDAGYTIVEYGGGREDAGAPEGYRAYADLNQGAGSALKGRRVVYLGYKTTAEREGAVTDLAAMGMDGGYSFSDYRELMGRYRDQTVAPLQAKVMRMVAEYRANASSGDPASRSKAEIARAMLNRFTDEDSGGAMGDLLLRGTSQELGATPSAMGGAEAAAWRAAHPGVLDLECALMQGNADVVANVETILASATDATGTTWLRRLSDLGPDGLDAATADLTPTDARAEMDARYQDAARLVAAGWDELRAELAAYAAAHTEEEAPALGASAGADGVVAEGADEAAPDVSELTNLELPEEEAREVSPEDAPGLVGDLARDLEAAAEAVDAAAELRAASVYHELRSLPWGGGSLYDYFDRPASEFAGDAVSGLYPLVSVLTDGQLASLEFQTLSSLAQAGASTPEAYAAVDPSASSFSDAALAVPETSVYQGVNRAIFGDLTALTSEAMRKQALNAEGAGAWDFLSRHKVTVGLAAGAVVSGMVAGLSAIMRSRSEGLYDLYEKTIDTLYQMKHKMKLESFSIKRVAGAPSSRAYEVTMVGIEQMNPLSVEVTGYFSSNSGLSESMGGFDDAMENFEDARSKLAQKRWDANLADRRWATAKRAASVAGVVLALASIASAAYDIYRYYNVDYTPIPRFVVDEKDVTATDSDGNRVVVRNDAAYFEVARTNRAEDADHRAALRDFADLNGDGGRGWLALYACRDSEASAPILADSLRVVTGTSSVPDGYADGVHMFGSGSAANLTDARYCYNDDAGGVYAYFKREVAPAAPAAASAFSGGPTALVGGLCLVAGAAAGSGATALAYRRRKGGTTA